MVCLMEMLVRSGCKDNLKITFNLPPKFTKRMQHQKLKICTIFYKTEKLMEKNPVFGIIRASCVELSFDRNKSAHVGGSGERVDKSVATSKTQTTDSIITAQESHLFNYCKFMGHQLEKLTLCLNKMAELVEVNSETYFNNPIKSIKNSYESIKENEDLKNNPVRNYNYFGNPDEYTIVLQELCENFNTIVPILENNRECAVELLKLVVNCKTIVNRVETKLVNVDTITNSVQTESLAPSGWHSQEVHPQTAEDYLLVKESIVEKTPIVGKQLTNDDKENRIDMEQRGVYVQNEAAYVLLPKDYTITKTGKQVGEELDLYVMQKLQKNNEDLTDEIVKATENPDRNSTTIKPILSQPMTTDEEEEAESTISYITNSDEEELADRYITKVGQNKPSIVADDDISNTQILNLLPGKPKTENISLPMLESIESNVPYTLKDCYKNLMKLENVSNTNAEILEKFTYIGLVGEKMNTEHITQSETQQNNQYVDKKNVDDFTNQQNKTSNVDTNSSNSVSDVETIKTAKKQNTKKKKKKVNDKDKSSKKIISKWKTCGIS